MITSCKSIYLYRQPIGSNSFGWGILRGYGGFIPVLCIFLLFILLDLDASRFLPTWHLFQILPAPLYNFFFFDGEGILVLDVIYRLWNRGLHVPRPLLAWLSISCQFRFPFRVLAVRAPLSWKSSSCTSQHNYHRSSWTGRKE